jgi:hypothetical protein
MKQTYIEFIVPNQVKGCAPTSSGFINFKTTLKFQSPGVWNSTELKLSKKYEILESVSDFQIKCQVLRFIKKNWQKAFKDHGPLAPLYANLRKKNIPVQWHDNEDTHVTPWLIIGKNTEHWVCRENNWDVVWAINDDGSGLVMNDRSGKQKRYNSCKACQIDIEKALANLLKVSKALHNALPPSETIENWAFRLSADNQVTLWRNTRPGMATTTIDCIKFITGIAIKKNKNETFEAMFTRAVKRMLKKDKNEATEFEIQ